MHQTTITTIPIDLTNWKKEQTQWNHSSSFFIDLHERADRQAQVSHFIAFLKEKNLMPLKGATALDVGCATADYAIGLAEENIKVSAIDLSDGMIKGAKQLADKHKVALDLYIGPWSEETRALQKWDQTFDFTYSFFCPVMYETENIKALSKASKGTCLWGGFSKRRDEIYDMLVETLYGKDEFAWTDKAEGVVEFVKTIGKNVKVYPRILPETETFTLEEALKYFMHRMHDNKEETKAKIKALLLPLVKDGKITNHTEDHILWVTWETC